MIDDSQSTSTRRTASVRYLECLESSCFNFVREHQRIEKLELIDRAAAVLKLHALFGGRLVVDSMAILGSQVLLSLFADQQFRSFLAVNPHFLSLRSVYRGRKKNLSRREIALSGFSRATERDWVSSTFRNQNVIRRLAQFILKSQDIDPGRILAPGGAVRRLIETSPDDGVYIEGATYGAAHFAHDTRAYVGQGLPSVRVYQILKESVEAKRVRGNHEALIKRTMEFGSSPKSVIAVEAL